LMESSCGYVEYRQKGNSGFEDVRVSVS
jgi:hypothetical protein